MEIGVEQVENQSVAFVRRTVKMDELRSLYDEVFSSLPGQISDAGGEIAGPPFGWYHGTPAEVVDVAVGFPVSGMAPGSLVDHEEVMVDERIGGRAVVGVHVGSYEGLPAAYEAIFGWIETEGEAPRDDMWEEYLSDPTETDESELRTRIVSPVR